MCQSPDGFQPVLTEAEVEAAEEAASIERMSLPHTEENDPFGDFSEEEW